MSSQEHGNDGSCTVTAKADFVERLDAKVMAVAAHASSNGKARLVVRVGRVLIYIEDWDALVSFADAWQQAVLLGQQLFAPLPDAFTEADARARRDLEQGRRAHI